ncbi:Hypothetical_protein [Hexamita inflata]|uniref:Hypothetical_protein n=1 Tax=Hexamita inflata TaxID=28002 RepID=A0AA86NB73_9EUKA|nr:Hypothetical protein HINF_LOCUS3755 [Hexamita inflata]
MGVSEVKNSQITLSVCNPRNTNFALLSQNSLIVQSSSFNVSLTDNILQGALVCTKCDLIAQESTFIFVANGQNISGLIIESIKNINIDQCFVQLRTNSVLSAGIVVQIKTVLTFYMSNSKISAYYFNLQEYNAVIAVVCQVQTTFEINTVKYYSNALVFNDQSFVTMTQQPVKNPNICDNLNYLVYGICLKQLIYGQMLDNTYQCVYPFEYNGIVCICAEGYILNFSYCVSIINQLNILENRLIDNILVVNNNLDKQFTELEIHITNNISEIEIHLQSNITNQQQQILTFTKETDINLLQNTTILDWRIYNNHTMITSSLLQMNDTIMQKLSYLNSNLSLVNTTLITSLQNQQYTIEQRLLNNISNLNNNIQSQFVTSYSNLTQNSQMQDQHIINNISLIKSIITTVNSTQNQLRDNLQTDLSSQIASLQSQITALTAQVTANQNSATNSISILQSNLNSNTASLNSQITYQANTAQANLINLNSTIQSQMNTIQNNMNTLNTKMAGTVFKSISNVRNTCLQDVCYPCT